MVRFFFILMVSLFSISAAGQGKSIVKGKIDSEIPVKNTEEKTNLVNYAVKKNTVPALIPFKKNGKYGFIDHEGKMIIAPVYSDAGFFTTDCNLLNSPNEKIQKFGSDQYATVRLNDADYRVNSLGKRVYQYIPKDLGRCPAEFKKQLYHAYIMNYSYGIIEDATFENPGDYRQFTIYPQYQYLHILEGDDLNNPMIVAVRNNRFGIIDLRGKTIIPFIYKDIKRNYSWKLARLFQVSLDGKNYFYLDENNRAYGENFL